MQSIHCVKNRLPVRLALLALLGAMFVSAEAQEGASQGVPADPMVEGQIYDHRGGGVADVEVELLASDAGQGDAPIATGKTNGYGDFAIHHPQPLSGSFVVVFRKKNYSETRRDIEIAPGELPPFVELLLPGGLSVSGVVRDKADDTPVAEALVRFSSAGRDRETRTDRGGAFAFDQVHPAPATLRIDAQGFARQTISLDLGEGGVDPLRVALVPDRVCRIKITDWQGEAISGASVSAIDDVLKEKWNGQTGEDGFVVFRGIPAEAERLALRVSHADYISDADFEREITLPSGTRQSEHRENLSPAGGVVGTILDAETERPLHGVRVTVGEGQRPGLARAWTDFDGAFTVGGVLPGKSVVTAYLRGHAPELAGVNVLPGETSRVDLKMGATLGAGGVVVGADGGPVAGAYVFATMWRDHATLGIDAMTDAEGRFSFDTVPADEFEVAVQAAGHDVLSGRIITPGKSDHKLVMTAKVEREVVELVVGDPFPELEMKTLDGAALNLKDLRGKIVLIDFWATWCLPCVAEVPQLVALHEALGKRDDFAMINISLDADGDRKKLTRFVEKHNMAWAQVFGSEGGAQAVAERCGVISIPRRFLIGRDGELRLLSLSIEGLTETVTKALNDVRTKVVEQPAEK